MPMLLDQPRRASRRYDDADGDEEPCDLIPPPDGPGGGDDGRDDDDDNEHGDGDGDDRGPGRWVTVATFWKAPDAHMARIRLEAEGIDCVIFDETLVATDWLMANAVGGIKLRVPEADAVVARSLLIPAAGAHVVDDPEPVADGQSLCPRCGSDAVYPARLSRRMAFLSILLLGLPLPMLLRRTRCAACAFEWA